MKQDFGCYISISARIIFKLEVLACARNDILVWFARIPGTSRVPTFLLLGSTVLFVRATVTKLLSFQNVWGQRANLFFKSFFKLVNLFFSNLVRWHAR
jgi:hypothetical protein